MSYYIQKFCIILGIFLLTSCVEKTKLDLEIEKEMAKLEETTKKAPKDDEALYRKIFKNISSNLDLADEGYVDLKSDFEKSPFLEKAALALAVAHMQKQEYILANFYLQEALAINKSNELAKYLLSKNQFLYAKSVANDQTYMEKAIKSLEVNKNILHDREYKLLANSMLIRTKLDKVYNNQSIGKMYKKLNKNKAYELYINKTLNLNINPNDIYKK